MLTSNYAESIISEQLEWLPFRHPGLIIGQHSRLKMILHLNLLITQQTVSIMISFSIEINTRISTLLTTQAKCNSFTTPLEIDSHLLLILDCLDYDYPKYLKKLGSSSHITLVIFQFIDQTIAIQT